MKIEVLSPDGFTIEFDKPYYTSKEMAMDAFHEWKERYRRQGYYSSNNGRIPLEDLENYMSIKKID
jgi:Ca2+-binding EF-hand superfamily protein